MTWHFVFSVEKAIEQIEDANKFTSRLLEHGSAAEVLSLRQLVSTQLMNLINNTPKPDVNTTLEFVTDMDKFTAAIQVTNFYFISENIVQTTVNTPVIRRINFKNKNIILHLMQFLKFFPLVFITVVTNQSNSMLYSKQINLLNSSQTESIFKPMYIFLLQSSQHPYYQWHWNLTCYQSPSLLALTSSDKTILLGLVA